MNPAFDRFTPLAAIATTPASARRLQLLCDAADATLWVPPALAHLPGTKAYSGSLRDCLADLWPQHRAFVFGLAAGAVVRLIAPLLQDKSVDPAVVTIDEGGKFVVSLCSGHQGGGDRLTQLLARQLGATPVITGTCAESGLPAVDLLGEPFGWRRGSGDWTGVSAAIARGEKVQVIQEAGSNLWQQHLPEDRPFQLDWHDVSPPQGRIWISFTQRQFDPDSELPKVQWHPRVLWVGMGCERGTPKAVLEAAIARVFRSHHLAEDAIAGVATIDIKHDEVGLVELCRDRAWKLRTFPAEQLNAIAVPNPSDTVKNAVGTASVAEASAIAAVETKDSAPLLVSKQVYREDGQPGAVTVAVAKSDIEFVGRTGQLFLVGMGPGKLEQMTPAAQNAIASADAVIGYSLYIDLVRPLLQAGQIVESLPITEERNRAQRAIALANWGLSVAVISSGDCGIYGMAGLVFEALRSSRWDGKIPQVQVFPGVTAMQAAAARIGAPLMHDFCAISLSDLLTPWNVIEQRLQAAATADFVVGLYNPKSQKRIEQIAAAQSIFLQHRSPQTPVAIVRCVYREDERIVFSTLQHFLEEAIDMLSVVLIGNSTTTVEKGWMVTPRGYYQ